MVRAGQAQRLLDDTLLWEILEEMTHQHVKAIEDLEAADPNVMREYDDDYCRNIRAISRLRRNLKMIVQKYTLQKKKDEAEAQAKAQGKLN